MEFKTRQQLYNETRDKLVRYETGEYYLCSALNDERDERWVKADDVIQRMQEIIQSEKDRCGEANAVTCWVMLKQELTK